MACESTGLNQKRVNQFNKIMLLNGIANQIASYAVQCGNATFMDYVDMNCGAIPEGPIEQVVDPESPHQFLSMYMQIAEKRFAFAVTGLLKMDPNFINQLMEFCNRVGEDMDLPCCEDMEAAYSVYDSFILDGMPCDETKKVVHISENRVVWQKLIDTHEAAWLKAEGSVENYYKLLACFVHGLFKKSGINLSIENKTTFVLER